MVEAGRSWLGPAAKVAAATVPYAGSVAETLPAQPAIAGLDSYELDAAYHDEAFAVPLTPRPQARLTPRPHYAALLAGLSEADLSALLADSAAAVSRRGVHFTSAAGGDAPFQLDPIPRIFAADEWTLLEAGLAQRARALNAFVADAYGEQRIVDAGRVPARVIDGAEHYEPSLAGVATSGVASCGVLGLDVVRGADGTLAVLEDNARTPSGLAYSQAALDVVDEILPGTSHAPLRTCAWASVLHDALRAAAPDGDGEPAIALLSDGPENSAWWEHEQIARLLGIPLVTLADLELGAGRLHARIGGRRRPLDVVYRRTSDDRATDEQGRPTAVAQALLEPIRAGRLACVNALGAGVADDKLAHAYVEEMIRFYLGDEPLVPSVRTFDLVDPEQLRECLERIDEMVVKPRTGHGGQGVVVCAHAEPEDRRRAAEHIARHPEEYVAQELVNLSRHPTVEADALVARHIDLRPFVLSAGERVTVLPGGLTRVAFAPGALVVNSSQDGGGKATWVLA